MEISKTERSRAKAKLETEFYSNLGAQYVESKIKDYEDILVRFCSIFSVVVIRIILLELEKIFLLPVGFFSFF